MASIIFLGALRPEQNKVINQIFNLLLIKHRNIRTHKIAIIAKGNIIEGIEAKE